MSGPPAKHVLFPELRDGILFQPLPEGLGIKALEQAFPASSFDHHDVLGLELIHKGSGLRGQKDLGLKGNALQKIGNDRNGVGMQAQLGFLVQKNPPWCASLFMERRGGCCQGKLYSTPS